MNLTHLRYMVEVERLGSITKAASALYMGQPNLSKAIKEMEREVGIPIFKRNVQRVLLPQKRANSSCSMPRLYLCKWIKWRAFIRIMVKTL